MREVVLGDDGTEGLDSDLSYIVYALLVAHRF